MILSKALVLKRERKYVAARARGMTQAEAIKAAGYKGTNAKHAGWEMEQKPRVKARLAKVNEDALAAAGVTRMQIVRELARVAMLDPRKILDEFGNVREFDKIDDDTAAALAGMDVEELFAGSGAERTQVGTVRKVKFWNKVDALKELSRIARLVADAPPQAPTTGPGLQVIIQQQIATGPQAGIAQRIEVNLPGPALQVNP